MRSGGWKCCAAGPRTSTAAPRWAGWFRSSPGPCPRVRSCGPKPRRATRGRSTDPSRWRAAPGPGEAGSPRRASARTGTCPWKRRAEAPSTREPLRATGWRTCGSSGRGPSGGAGGRARTVGVFAEDLFQVTSRLLVVAAARFEHWRQEDGFSETRPLAPASSPVTHTAFPDRGESALSPRVSVLFRAAPGLSLVAAGYGAFRGPTLNELYRSFRVGDTLTRANESLTAERLAGGEAGAHWTGAAGRLRARATVFSSDVRDPVANVTR